jgi:hypothetical protein
MMRMITSTSENHGDTPTPRQVTATTAVPATNASASVRALRYRPISAPMIEPPPQHAMRRP